MDRQTSLSQMVLAAIPPAGIRWAALRAQLPQFPSFAIEYALNGLLIARLARRVTDGEIGIWYRAGFEPPRDKESQSIQFVRAKRHVLKVHELYNSEGLRWCTRRQHYLPKDQFQKGSRPDGLHGWCKTCRHEARVALRAMRRAPVRADRHPPLTHPQG